jgi:hypothetical protein
MQERAFREEWGSDQKQNMNAGSTAPPVVQTMKPSHVKVLKKKYLDIKCRF